MSNEQFLTVLYFCAAALCVAIGAGTYLRLKGPLAGASETLPWRGVRQLLRSLFPAGILLPALLGFVTVSYRGCNMQEYQKIVTDRAYLIGKSQEQIGSTLTYLLWAIFAWSALLAALIALKRLNENKPSE